MSRVGSLDPYSMKILELCYIIWSTCSSLQSGHKKVELAENQVLASPRRISHPEGHFPQGFVNAVKKINQGKMVHAIEISFMCCHDLITRTG